MLSIPVLMAFYHVTATEDWTCINVVEYYRTKVEQKDFKQVLDRVRKDLQEVADFNSEFDTTLQAGTASLRGRALGSSSILHFYRKCFQVLFNCIFFRQGMGYVNEEPEKDLRVNIQVEQQILATDSANQTIHTVNSRCGEKMQSASTQ
ncbi:10358_t:CDS:2, partial [Funneliformis geosporum]